MRHCVIPSLLFLRTQWSAVKRSWPSTMISLLAVCNLSSCICSHTRAALAQHSHATCSTATALDSPKHSSQTFRNNQFAQRLEDINLKTCLYNIRIWISSRMHWKSRRSWDQHEKARHFCRTYSNGTQFMSLFWLSSLWRNTVIKIEQLL